MVLVVLMQRPRSEGLGAAFGSGMTENIFGAQTTHVLAKFTTWLGGTFFLLTLALAVIYSHLNSRESSIQRDLMDRPAPVATPASTAPLPAASPAKTTAPAATPAAAPASAQTSAPAATPAAAQPVAPLAPATPPAAPAPATP
jgi:preprotein translocase subunit SecG